MTILVGRSRVRGVEHHELFTVLNAYLFYRIREHCARDCRADEAVEREDIRDALDIVEFTRQRVYIRFGYLIVKDDEVGRCHVEVFLHRIESGY